MTQWAMPIMKNTFTSKSPGTASPRSMATHWIPLLNMCHTCKTWSMGKAPLGMNAKSADRSHRVLARLKTCTRLPNVITQQRWPFSANPLHQTALAFWLLLHVPSPQWHTEGDPRFAAGSVPGPGAGRRSHQLCCTPEGAAQRGPGPGAPPGGLRRSPQPAQARPGSAAWGRPEACGLPGARRARPARGGEVLGEGEPGA